MDKKNYARKSKISEDQRKEIAEFYRDSKLWGAREVADIYDISESAVRYAVKKYGCQKSKSPAQDYTSKLETIAEVSESPAKKTGIWENIRNKFSTTESNYRKKLASYSRVNVILATGVAAVTLGVFITGIYNNYSNKEKPAQSSNVEQIVQSVPSKAVTPIVSYVPIELDSFNAATSPVLEDAEIEVPNYSVKSSRVNNLKSAPENKNLKPIIFELASDFDKSDLPETFNDKKSEITTRLPISDAQPTDFFEVKIPVAKKIEPAYTTPVESSEAMITPIAPVLTNTLDEIVASTNDTGNFYGLAGVGAIGDVNFIGEVGYKTADWGFGASIDNTAFQLKYGLFNNTDAEIDATVALILGKKSGAGVMFGKDNVFGEDNSWNFRYGAGLGSAGHTVVPVFSSIKKSWKNGWGLGLEARANIGSESGAGVMLGLSYGNNDVAFENDLDGFTGVVRSKDSSNDSGDTSSATTQNTNRKDDGKGNPDQPVNPPQPPVNPTRTDGTGRPDII